MTSSTLILITFIYLLNSWWRRSSDNQLKVAVLFYVKHNAALDSRQITDDDIEYLCDYA
jgi:hypothetical protein